MKILIIESDPSFAQSAADALQARGAETLIVDDGQEGMNLAREERPAALILSVELGERLHAGFSWCNRIKKDEALKDIPLLLVSSLATEDTFEQHRRLKTRADEYLIKPFPTEVLLERMESMLPALAQSETDEASPFGDLDLGDEDEPLFGPLDGAPASSSTDLASLADEDLQAPIAVNGEEAPRTTNQLAGASDAPVPDEGDFLEDLDLEDLFSQDTEQFATTSLGWGDDDASPAEPTDALLAAAAVAEGMAEDVAGASDPEVSSGSMEFQAADAAQADAAAEEKVRDLTRRLEEAQAALAAAEAATQQAQEEARRARDEVQQAQEEARQARDEVQRAQEEAQQAREETRRAQEEAQQARDEVQRAQEEARQARDEVQQAQEEARQAREEAARSDAKARDAARADEETQRKVEAMQQQVQAALSWKTRAEEAEAALAEHRALVERLQRRLQQDEQVRQRAHKAVSVAAELLQTLGRQR